MQITNKLAALLLFFCATATSCMTTTEMSVQQAMEAPVSQVSLSIQDTAGKIDAEQIGTLRTAVGDQLAKAGVTVVPPSAGVAVLEGKIQELETGSQFVRWFVGFGAGAGRLTTTWLVLDGKDKGTVGACAIRARLAGGVLGGDFRRVYNEVGDRLGTFLAGRSQ